MRILFLTSRMPYPPERGDRFRVFHFIRAAALAGHEVHLVTLDTRPRDDDSIAPLTRFTASTRVVRMPPALSAFRAMTALGAGRPLQLAYYESKRMSACVEDALARVRPDAVYTHLFRMAPYALTHMRGGRAAWILDLTDVISTEIVRSLPFRSGPDRWIHVEESRRIERYERSVAPRFDECWVISETEARRLSALAPEACVRVVPNGVGLGGDGSGGGDSGRSGGSGGGPREPARLLFLGNHKVFHNRDAARFLVREILPLVRAQVPDAALDIVGKDAESLGGWTRADGVRVLGYVPHLEDALARAAVFVAPHRFAAGVQNKVVQALAAGTPVVTTPLVREGLTPIPADLLRVGETAPEIAAQVVDLIRNPAAAAELGARGREWARTRFQWEFSVRAFEAAAARVATRHESRPAPVTA